MGAIAAVLALVAAASFALAATLWQRASIDAGVEPGDSKTMLMLLTSWVWLLGLGAQIVGVVLQAAALDRGRVTVIQPLLVTSIVWALPLGYFLTQQTITRQHVFGAAIIVVGLAVFAIFGDPAAGDDNAPTSDWIAAFVVLAAGAAHGASRSITHLATADTTISHRRAEHTGDTAMPGAGTHRRELKNTGYEIFIGILSVLSIVNLVLLYAIEDPSLNTVLRFMNAILSGIFLIDFTYRLFTAESKTTYFFRRFGWADLLASLPFQQVKILRVFRLERVIRLLRAYGIKNVGRSLLQDRAGSALLTLLLMGILVLEFGSLEILHIEQNAPGANITTASDALWYTIVTISTVGYGDRYPVTNDGRIVGSFIIIVGVGIFGTFTGYLANLFLSPSKKRTAAPAPDTDDRRIDVDQLQALMVQQQAAIDEINLLLRADRT